MTDIKIVDDDDVVMIIVSEESEDVQTEEFPMPGTVKIEPLDEDYEDTANNEILVEDILNLASQHGEFVDIKDVYKTEVVSDENEDLTPFINESYKPRKVMVDPKNAVSFVNEVRKQFPEMRNDEHKLIKHLTNIMRNLKCPSPPNIEYKKLMDDGKYSCSFCHKITVTEAAADRHFQAKHGPRYLKCLACGVDFTNTGNLYKHEKRCHHPDAQIVLKARARFLGRKGRSRPFLTDGKFITKDRTQKRVSRYQCSQCLAQFLQQRALEAHQLTHVGSRPYQCDVCPAAFNTKGNLKRHLSTHSDREYICDHCNKSFKQKSSLKTHLDVHLPEPKFACTLCSSRFAQKTGLDHHMNIHHLLVPPPCACPVCPKRYPRMSHVKLHMRRVHGLNLMTRKMFIKSLPTMNSVELERALVMFANEAKRNQIPSDMDALEKEVLDMSVLNDD